MKLSPTIMRAAYDFLRITPPFNRWGLPPGSEVSFKTKASGTARADLAYHYKVDGKHEIGISQRKVSHLRPLMETLAHEVCHIRATEQGERSDHGRLFNRAAMQVCRSLGFDPKHF